ncbi:MAG: DUF58 domain-containing protein [Actinobacteria bacterium]|nr:DUF58 domain-containing protein [Actinomycetota bacterium]
MIVPTRRLALVALLVGVAVAFFPAPVNGGLLEKVLVLNAIVLAVAFADVAAAPKPSAIDVRREHPPVVGLGQTATVSWSVRNGAQRRAVVAVADGFRPSLTARNRRFRLRLSGGAVGHATTTICPTRRGRFEISEVVLRVEGPLGLAARQQRRSVPTVLHVHPKFHSREEAELRIRKARILDVGLRSARGVGGGTEFEQLREYTPDDEFRRVDWSASARAGRPIVRTYRPERHQSVMVLLDNGRLMAAHRWRSAPGTRDGRRDHVGGGVDPARRSDRARDVRSGGAFGARPGGSSLASGSDDRGDVRPGAGARGEQLPRCVRSHARPVPPPIAARAADRPLVELDLGVPSAVIAADPSAPHRVGRRGSRSRRGRVGEGRRDRRDRRASPRRGRRRGR